MRKSIFRLAKYSKMSHLMTKPSKWAQRRQISLGIRRVWSESSLCAQWVAKDQSFLHADSEDGTSAQSDLSFRWAHMPCCWFCHEVALIHVYRRTETSLVRDFTAQVDFGHRCSHMPWKPICIFHWINRKARLIGDWFLFFSFVKTTKFLSTV